MEYTAPSNLAAAQADVFGAALNAQNVDTWADLNDMSAGIGGALALLEGGDAELAVTYAPTNATIEGTGGEVRTKLNLTKDEFYALNDMESNFESAVDAIAGRGVVAGYVVASGDGGAAIVVAAGANTALIGRLISAPDGLSQGVLVATGVNYVYLTQAGTLSVTASATPAADTIPLASAAAVDGLVTEITDLRTVLSL